MARKKNINTRRRAPKQPRSFGRTLVWAFMLAIVFSVGLIAGQRLIDRENTPALVSLSTVGVSPLGEGDSLEKAQAEEPVTFSFYERLGTEKPASVASLGDSLSRALKVQEAEALPARYTLQLGAHPSMDKARKQVSQLAKLGIEAHVTAGKSEKNASRKVYRVRVGKFHSMDEARQFQGALKSQRELDTFLMPL